MGKFIDLTGQRFGMLTVLSKSGKNKHSHIVWSCKCDCGNTCVVESSSLRRGSTNSCGCLRSEYLHSPKAGKRTHGKSKTRLYAVWRGMKQRCNDPNGDNYHRYGGRGISVCEEWESNFSAFEKWALENGYDETAPQGKFTVDRINNDGNYEPLNCRIVDMKVQYHNRDVPKSLKEIAEEHGLTYDAVHQRMKKGETLEKALKKPLRRKVRVQINGEEKTVKEISRESGIPESTIYYREKLGLDWKDILDLRGGD